MKSYKIKVIEDCVFGGLATRFMADDEFVTYTFEEVLKDFDAKAGDTLYLTYKNRQYKVLIRNRQEPFKGLVLQLLRFDGLPITLDKVLTYFGARVGDVLTLSNRALVIN